VVAQQVRAIERFNRARHMREEAAAAAARSREMRMDAARSLEVLRREHEALVSRAHEQLQASGHLLRTVATRRVVLAHRNDWFFRQVTQALEDSGVHVLAGTDNGADAVGLVVAEQPDLVLVEDTLSMLPGVEVVREIRRFSPETVVTAQAAYGDRVGQLLDAGASAVFTRRIPPADVARSLLRLVGAA
jgi:CheY-like chemotaxis protein